MRNSVESLLSESFSLNKLHYKKAARVMHCKVLFIIVEDGDHMNNPRLPTKKYCTNMQAMWRGVCPSLSLAFGSQ